VTLQGEFLRIEIKTETPDRRSLNGRFKPFDGECKTGLNKMEFENSQLRVTRIISRRAYVSMYRLSLISRRLS